MGSENGITFVKYVKENYPSSKTLGFSLHNENSVISEFMKAGGNGYINKQSDEAELADAIRSVYNGKLGIIQTL